MSKREKSCDQHTIVSGKKIEIESNYGYLVDVFALNDRDV